MTPSGLDPLSPRNSPVGNWFAAVPVAIPPPWRETLRRGAPHGLRWYEVEDCHLTVAFFGRYRPESMEAVREVLAHIQGPNLSVQAGALKLLPSERRFSAIALGFSETPAPLLEFMAHWAPRLAEAAGVPPDPRPPLPHTTLARPERRSGPHQQREIAAWAAAVVIPPLSIELGRVALYGWAEDRSARQFRILE